MAASPAVRHGPGWLRYIRVCSRSGGGRAALGQPAVKGAQQQRMRAEWVAVAQAQAGVGAGCLGEQRGQVDLAVIRRGKEQRQDDDAALAPRREPGSPARGLRARQITWDTDGGECPRKAVRASSAGRPLRAASCPASLISAAMVAAARGSLLPCATASSGGSARAPAWPAPARGTPAAASAAALSRGCRIRSCRCLPSARCAGRRRARPARCRLSSRSTGSRRRPAG